MWMPVAASIMSSSSVAPRWAAWRCVRTADSSLRPGMPLGRLPMRIGYATSFRSTFPYLAQSFLIQRADTFISSAISEVLVPFRLFLMMYRTLDSSSFDIVRTFRLPIYSDAPK